MRQNVARVAHLALIAGLLLVAGAAGVDIARAADDAQQPWLGVYMQEMSDDLRDGFDYDGPGGVIVSRVVRGSPAEKAGLERDDVIVRLNGRLVDSPSELTEMVAEAGVGQRVSVQVFREGSHRTLGVTLGKRPAGAAAPEREIEVEVEVPDAPAAPKAPKAVWVPKAPKAPKAPKEAVERIVIKRPGRTIEIDGMDLEHLEGLRGLHGLEGFKGLDVLRDMDPSGARPFVMMAGRGRLGVRVEPLSPALGDYFALKDGKGALVLEVLKDRPAEKAGLLPGDVITRVDDKAVTNSVDLVDALRGKEGKVALRVVRHGTPRTIEATLDEPGPTWVEKPGTPSDEGPGVRKRIVVRPTERGDLRHELDRLKQELEKLRQQLEQESEEGDE